MAFTLGFTTQAHNQGKSILVVDSSTSWIDQALSIVEARLTITSLYSGVTLTTDPTVIIIDTTIPANSFEDGFQYEITAEDLFGAGYPDTVKDSIYNIEMTLYDGGGIVLTSGYSYESDEVFYYNMKYIRDSYISDTASYIDDVYAKNMDYANWLDFLVTTIEANTEAGNSSAIYYVFDIENRLSS